MEKMLLCALALEEYTETEVPEQTFDVVFENDSQPLGKENGQEKCENLKFPFSRSPLKNVVIKNSNILEPQSEMNNTKEIREITLDCKDFMELDWQPGDTIGILPNNPIENVSKILKLLEMESNADRICSVKISISCTKKNVMLPTYIPTSTTPREILRDCLNLKGILSKKFLRSLAEYCTDEQEKKFLKSSSSKENSWIYNDVIVKSRFNILDILSLCATCKPPFSLIIQYLPRLLPRPYSIANSPLKTNEEITIIFSTLENPGITTEMLQEKSSEAYSSLLIYLREPNYFRYTEDNYQQNQILIAVGTGLAPFLGFLQHKQYLMSFKKEKPGVTWLFLGTTTQQSVIDRDELLQWESKNVLNNFVESYSRTPKARYRCIQQTLEYNSKKLVELLMKPETYLYLCADGGLISKSIEQSLETVLALELDISKAKSNAILKDFKNKKKYREDTWN